MANLKLRRWLIKGPFKSERGGCREEKRIVVGCCCCGDDVKQMFVGRMKRKEKPLYQANHKGFVSKTTTPSTLTGTTQPAIIFLQQASLGLRSQAAAAIVRRGGCANTADVRFSL
jgi:hypothetical protein